MAERILSTALLKNFEQHLVFEEKSKITIEKYLRDTRKFQNYTEGTPITKELAMSYKSFLLEKGYAPRSINSMLASLNSLLRYLKWNDCMVINLRTQYQTYCSLEKELTR